MFLGILQSATIFAEATRSRYVSWVLRSGIQRFHFSGYSRRFLGFVGIMSRLDSVLPAVFLGCCLNSYYLDLAVLFGSVRWSVVHDTISLRFLGFVLANVSSVVVLAMFLGFHEYCDTCGTILL